MSYVICQSAVLTLVRAYNSGGTFTEANSAENDWTRLNAPGPIACVISQAGDTIEGYELDGYGEAGKLQERHEIGVTVAARIGTGKDAEALATLQAEVAALKAYLRQYPRLNGVAGVWRAQIVRTSKAIWIAPLGDAKQATHWTSTIVVRVDEELSPAFAESF